MTGHSDQPVHVFIDPAALPCPACGSRDTSARIPPSPPLRRIVLAWVASLACLALAIWYWPRAHIVQPVPWFVRGVDRSRSASAFLSVAILGVAWCAGLAWLSRRPQPPPMFTCGACGRDFEKPEPDL